MILEKLSSKELAMAAHTCKDFAGRMRQLRSHIRQLHITTGVHHLQLLLGWAAAGLWCTASKPQNLAVKPTAPGMVLPVLPRHTSAACCVLPLLTCGCWLRWNAATSDKLPQLLCRIPLDGPCLCCRGDALRCQPPGGSKHAGPPCPVRTGSCRAAAMKPRMVFGKVAAHVNARAVTISDSRSAAVTLAEPLEELLRTIAEGSAARVRGTPVQQLRLTNIGALTNTDLKAVLESFPSLRWVYTWPQMCLSWKPGVSGVCFWLEVIPCINGVHGPRDAFSAPAGMQPVPVCGPV